METLAERYGIKSGVVISAVDLIRGIGVYAGLRPVEVEGATGLYDTNYEGKVQAAIEALHTHDFVYLHIEASDEAGHEGDVDLKVRTVEYLDHRVLKSLIECRISNERFGDDSLVARSSHPLPVAHSHGRACPVCDLQIWGGARRSHPVQRVRCSRRRLWGAGRRAVYKRVLSEKLK